MRFLLFPFSIIYGLVILVRNFLYDIGVLKIRSLPCCVISVGNLTAGGTGKTPTVVSLGKFLLDNGFSIAVLSRGYGRNTTGTFIVSDGKTVAEQWQQAGDEPVMIANQLNGVPVVVDENRYRGGKVLVDAFQPDIILLDDAFQHRAVHRDINILLLNSLFNKENSCLLPVGNLREPKYQMKRADLIFLSKSNLYSSSKPPVTPKYIPVFPTLLETSSKLKSTKEDGLLLSQISGKKVLAISALGDPKGFEYSLFTENPIITDHLIFRDHHAFTSKDIENIYQKKIDTDSEFVITTDKDFIKLEHLVSDMFVLHSLSVAVVIPVDAKDIILSKIKQNE